VFTSKSNDFEASEDMARERPRSMLIEVITWPLAGKVEEGFRKEKIDAAIESATETRKKMAFFRASFMLGYQLVRF
jgi:hypothetical protein